METPQESNENEIDLQQQLAEALADLSEDITEDDSTFDTSSIESDEVDLEGHLSDNQNHDLALDNVIVLKPIHSIIQQLNKPKIKEHAGIPTCVAVDEFIAVGTSHGITMIFNSNHQLTTIFGNSENGGITCIDLNIITKDSIYWCVCGHSNGTIILWDMVTKKQIKSLKYYSSPILCVKFLPDTNRNRFIVSDTNGIVNVFTVSKMLLVNVVEGQLILNGNAGPILCMSPLMISVTSNDASYSLPYSIIAFATAQRVYIITLYTNSVEVHYKIEKPKGISSPKGHTIATIPTIAWSYVQPSALQKGNDAVKGKQKRGGIYLAVGWGNVIELYQLHLDHETGKLMFPRVNQIRLNSGDFINAIAWLSSRVLVVVDVLEQLRVIDPFASSEGQKFQLDTMDIKSLQLVYTRLPIKPAVTNQKKQNNNRSSTSSDTLPKMTRYFYMQSVGSQGNHIFLLGLEGVYDGILFTWQERIDNLVFQKKFTSALKLASMFYHDEIHVVIGNLPADTSRRKQIIAQKIVHILTAYQSYAFELYTSQSEGKPKFSKSAIEEFGVRCIEYCCLIDRVDILYGPIFDKYKQLGQQSQSGAEALNRFLELLEPAILRGSLTYVAPEVIQLWIDHYQQSSSMLRRAEQCILHLPISSLDFHQVATLCKKHNLLITFIYLYNRGLNDFSTPLEHILKVIQSYLDNAPDSSKSKKGQFMSVVNTCVSYIQCTLQGRYYSDVALVLSVTQSNTHGYDASNLTNFPTPPMEPQELEDSRNQILQYLFLTDDSGTFPWLRVFIDGLVESPQVGTSPSKVSGKGSIKKLLDCLRVVFDDGNYSAKAKVTYNMMMDAILIAFGIAGNNVSKPRSAISSFIQFEVFQFIVEYYAKGKLECSQRPVLLNSIINFLSADDLDMDPQYRSVVLNNTPTSDLNNTPTSDLNPVHSAKEVVFLMLVSRLFSTTHSVPNIDLDRVLVQAEGAHFYKVANYLYQLKRNYNKILECQIRDSTLKVHNFSLYVPYLAQNDVFKLIKSILDYNTNDSQESDTISAAPPATLIPITEDDKGLLKVATINHLHELITIDSHVATKLMMQYFTAQQDKVLRKLDSYPHLQFIYLSNLFAKEHFQAQTSDNNSKTLVTKSGVVITGDIQVLYVKLMCVYSPSNVYNYLLSQINYPLDECLNICRQYKVTDATAYLLERTGDVPGALSLLLEVVTASLVQLHKYYRNGADSSIYLEAFPSGAQEKDSYSKFVSCVSLCQRNSQKLQDSENEVLWFRLLDIVVEPLRKLRDQNPLLKEGPSAPEISTGESRPDYRMQECLTHLVQLALSSMMGYVPFRSILSKIVTDHGANAFGDFKAIIIAMMDTYAFEKTILGIACHLTDQDMHSAVKDFYKKRSKAFHPKLSKCIICARPLSAKFDDLGKTFSATRARSGSVGETDSIFRSDSTNQKLGNHESSLITIFACGHAYHRVCLKTRVGQSHVSSAGCALCSKKDEKDEKDPFSKSNDNNNNVQEPSAIQAQFKEKLDDQLLLKAKQKKKKKSFTAVIREETPRYQLLKNLQVTQIDTRKQRRAN